MVSLIVSRHPLGVDRICSIEIDIVGMSVADFVESHFPEFNGDRYGVSINSEIVPHDKWADTEIDEGDCVVLYSYAAGGEGGSSALVAIAVIAGAFLLPGIGGAFTTALLKGLVSLGGNLLLSAFSGRGRESQERPQLDKPSPVYSVSAARNNARFYQPMMVVYGRHRVAPDLGALPYTVYEGNNQILYQVFHLGVSDVEVSDVRIGDTDLEAYKEASVEISDSTGAITSFHANVNTAEGANLDHTNWVERTTAAGTTRIQADFELLVFAINDEGNLVGHYVAYRVEFRPVGTSGWATAANFGITGSSRDVVRRSESWDVPEGQYEVRVRRTTNLTSEDNKTEDILYVQLKSYQPDSGDYSQQYRMGLRVRASGQLNGTIDQLNCVLSAKIPASVTVGAQAVETSNPAWAFLDFARGRTRLHHSGTKQERVYGVGLPDTQIDLDGIEEWAAWCDENALTCNVVFQGGTCEELLSIIANCGRAAITWQTGKLGVVYDEADRPPTAQYGMANIVAGSFQVNYTTQRTVEEVIVTYNDASENWREIEVRAQVPAPEGGEAYEAVSLNLAGVTDATQAAREANLIAAAQFYRRRRITFDTDVEGFITQRGDVVSLSHDLTSWAYSGRLLATNGVQHDLAREIDFDPTKQHWMQLRYVDGTYEVQKVVQTGPRQVTSAMPMTVPSNPMDVIYTIDPDDTPGKMAKVVSIKYKGGDLVTVECVDEFPEYYASENNPTFTPPRPDYIGRAPHIVALKITEVLIDVINNQSMVTFYSQMNEADGFYLEVVVNGQTTYSAQVPGNSVSFAMVGGTQLTATAKPYKIGAPQQFEGNTVIENYTVQGLADIPPDVQNFTATRNGSTLNFKWTPIPNSVLDFKAYELRKGQDYISSTLVGQTIESKYSLVDAQGGTYLLYATDTTGNRSTNPAVITVDPWDGTNVVFATNEPPWTGVHNGTIEFAGGVTLAGKSWQDWSGNTWSDLIASWKEETYGGVTLDNGYYDTQVVDVGNVHTQSIDVVVDGTALLLSGSYTWKDLNSSWAAYKNPDYTWAGPSGGGLIEIEWQYSEDNVAWSSWQEFVPGEYKFRYFRLRFKLTQLDTQYVPVLQGYTATIDVLDRIVVLENVVVPVSGIQVNFDPPFFRKPSLSLVLEDGVQGDAYQLTNHDNTGVYIEAFDVVGTPKQLTVDLHARGH